MAEEFVPDEITSARHHCLAMFISGNSYRDGTARAHGSVAQHFCGSGMLRWRRKGDPESKLAPP